ncbi:MAG: aldolase catalytic domain-containing protein [Methylovulum miyakonense]|uniref:aldolase catalytic domain-containing protein n=1 Tax=Methylovulum miyakonense TaxID=645578 RepID=UPI003BB81015
MLTLIDCTLRDGGYYNDWDFSKDLIADYLVAMESAGIEFIELGFRSFNTDGFHGACAYTTDDFINRLVIPPSLKIGVMMNASELINHIEGPLAAIQLQFVPAQESPVTLVRFACHVHEFEATLPMCAWLKQQGYMVGINLMQVADRSETEIENIGDTASNYDLDVLYFADSMGSLEPHQAAKIVKILRRHWHGAIGIHTHDNMGRAMSNTLSAISEGVTWVDSTVTGMGRGPGNVQTEYIVIELESQRKNRGNLTPLLSLITKHFKPMQRKYGWGYNPYYYIAGKFGIHPTYVQAMLSDSRYSDADILAVLDHLKSVGGKKFSFSNLDAGRTFFHGEPRGDWEPALAMRDREVLILATGSGVRSYCEAIETYIQVKSPFVIALNTKQDISDSLIDVRAACHPVRLLADCENYSKLPQPLVCPVSMLPENVRAGLSDKELLDFGIQIRKGTFGFNPTSCILPTGLVIAYALAIASSGGAKLISIAGLDGYEPGDPRNIEMDDLLENYMSTSGFAPLRAITPSKYRLPKASVFQLSN